MSKTTKTELEAQLEEARKKRQAIDKTMRQLQAKIKANARQEHDRVAVIIGRVALAAGLSDLVHDLDTLRGAFLGLAHRAIDPHQCARWHHDGQTMQTNARTAPVPLSPTSSTPVSAPPPRATTVS
jgi:hypothetical protein